MTIIGQFSIIQHFKIHLASYEIPLLLRIGRKCKLNIRAKNKFRFHIYYPTYMINFCFQKQLHVALSNRKTKCSCPFISRDTFVTRMSLCLSFIYIHIGECYFNSLLGYFKIKTSLKKCITKFKIFFLKYLF